MFLGPKASKPQQRGGNPRDSIYSLGSARFGSVSTKRDRFREQHGQPGGRMGNPNILTNPQLGTVTSTRSTAATDYPRFFTRSSSRVKPRYQPIADIDRILAETREEIQALHRVIEFRKLHGETIGGLPILTDKLSQKMGELELYNTNEDARMQHAWSFARDYDHDQKMREKAKQDKENRPPRAEAPSQFRSLRNFWNEKREAKRNTPEVIQMRETAVVKRRQDVAPIVAICERTLYLPVEQRDRIARWVVALPQEFAETGSPAPVPTYG
ncbi:hypothetical protein TWF281_001648 [Arthrobotrys megalospora]